MKRKTAFLVSGAILGMLIFSIIVRQHTWRAVSWDGHGEEKRTVGTTTWNGLGGASIEEITATYNSPEEARQDFEAALAARGTIIERQTGNDRFSNYEERVIKAFGEPETEEGKTVIMKLRDRQIHYISASGPEYALAFEHAWVKLSW